MDERELRARRSASQFLSAPGPSPVEVVRRLLGVQAQELRSARLAIRARTRDTTGAEVDRLLADGTLVVGWLMRGTLHMVDREDYWWLHGLTAPGRLAANRRRLYQEGVPPADAEQAVAVIERALVDAGPLTRPELVERLTARGIRTDGQAAHHLLLLAALRGVAVLGPLRSERQAFVLAHDWFGPPRPVERDAALAELARRYLAGHARPAPRTSPAGPACRFVTPGRASPLRP